MQRRHLEDSLATHLERSHLNHHREALDHENTADSQTVKAVGEVHGVGRPNHHDRNKKQKRDKRRQIEIRRTQETFQYQAWGEVFEKWKDQVGLVLPSSTQPDQRQTNAEAQTE